MIANTEGIEDAPDNRAMRQVPSSKTSKMANSLWISEDGCMRRRFYNPWTNVWSWGEIQAFTFNDEDEICGYLDGKKERVEKIIAFSWLKKRTPILSVLKKRNLSESTIAHNLYWEDDDASSSSEDEDSDESWKYLIWHTNGISCDDKYQISDRLRLKTPNGAYLKGNHFKHFGKFCAIRNSGLIDLQSAYQNVTIHRVPPSIRLAAQALLTGYTPKEFARQECIQDVTAWTYFGKAVELVDPNDAMEWGRKLVDTHMFDSLLRLDEEGNSLLGGRLSVLAEYICLPYSKLSELRFIITCLKHFKSRQKVV